MEWRGEERRGEETREQSEVSAIRVSPVAARFDCPFEEPHRRAIGPGPSALPLHFSALLCCALLRSPVTAMPDIPLPSVVPEDDNQVHTLIAEAGDTSDEVPQQSDGAPRSDPDRATNNAAANRDAQHTAAEVPGAVTSDSTTDGTSAAAAASSSSSAAANSSASAAASSSAAAASSSSSSSSSSSVGPASTAAIAAINAFAPNLRTTRDPAGVSELLTSQLSRIQSEVLARRIDGISDMAKFVQSVREEETNAIREDRAKWTKAMQQFNEPQRPKPVAGRRAANAKRDPRGMNVLLPNGSWEWRSPAEPIAEEKGKEDDEEAQMAAALAASAAEAEAVAAAATPVSPPPPPVYAPSAALLQCRAVSAHLLQWLQHHAVLDVLMGSHSHEEIVKRASPVLAFLLSNGALDFRKSVMSLWPATVGKHENFVRIAYEVIAKIVQELTLPQIQELFEQVTAPIYGAASGSSSSSSSSGSVASVASASASPVSSFVLSDYYLHFLADFTKNALKRTQFLWAEQQARENRGEADPIDADIPWPADAFNDNRAEGSAPIYAVRCFIDLLRRSTGGSGAASPAAPASLVIGLPADLHSVLVTQLLPDCLGAFPKAPILRDAKDACSAVVCESSAGVAARILRQCFTQLFEEAYNPATCLSVLRLADGVLRWFTLEKATVPGSFATSYVPPVSPPRESRQYVIGLVGDKVGSPIQLCVTLVTQHCKFVRGLLASTPAAVQANGDVQLAASSGGAGGLLHSALLQAIFDFFHGLLVSAPRGDIKTSHLTDLWTQLVEPVESSAASSKCAGPIGPQDMSIFSYFLYRLIDDDVRQFSAVHCPNAFSGAPAVGISDPFEHPAPVGADSPIPATSTLRLRKPTQNGSSTDSAGDSMPPVKSSSASSRAKAKAAECGFDSDDGINEDDIDIEDLDEAAPPANVHLVPSALKALLTQLIGHSHAFFESAPATIKSLNPKHDLHSIHFVSAGHTNLESVQLVLLRHCFFLANMYEPSRPVVPVQFHPHAKLERFDGQLVGVQILWNIATGGDLRRPVPGSPAAVLSPPLISSSLRRDVTSFLIELFTSKFVTAGMIVNQSPNIGAHKRAVIDAFLECIWKKITAIVAEMESDKNQTPVAAAALAQRLLLSLQLLDTYFEVDSKQYVSAFSSHVPPGVVGALSIFAGKFYNALFDLLQKFTSEPAAGRQRLGANITGPITELIFKLVMKLPQPAVDESKADVAGSELGAQSGGWTRRIVDFKFSNRDNPDWNELFSSTSTISLLFSLQTAFDWLKRTKTYGLDQMAHDVQSDSWRIEFCRQGGLRHLMGIFTSMEFDLRNLFYSNTTAATMPAPATAAMSEASIGDVASSSASPLPASSSSSSDNVLSKRCVVMLLKFLVDLVTSYDAARWEQTYYIADDSKRNIADLPRYTQQLQTLITEAIKASKAPVTVSNAAVSSSSSPPAATVASSIPAPGTLGSSFSANIGFLTPSPSPPAPAQLNRSASQTAAAAVSPVPDTDILTQALNLYNGLIVACIRQASPCDPAEKLAPGAVAQVRWDPVLLSPSFFRMMLLEGILHQPSEPFRVVLYQALEQLVDVCNERHPTYPRPLRWFFIELLNEILLHEPSIDWTAAYESQSSVQCLLDFMILHLHSEVEVEETHAVPKLIIARASGEFNPLTLASAMLDRAVRRPIHESAASGALMKPENTLCDFVLVRMLNVARECVDIVRWQTPAVWSIKGGKDCANIQNLLADRWLRSIFAMLTQLPEMANAASAAFTPGVIVNLPPKAKSYQSREACANLLKSLAFSNAATLSQVVALLAEFQDAYLKGDPFSSAKEWEFKLPEESASASSAASSSSGVVPYLGMRNLGNTCYINALVQQLFMIPDLRKNIQRISLSPEQMPTKGDPKSSVALQLQEIIASLAPGTALSRTAPGTEGFCKSFKDWDGISINPAIQEDSGIFFTRLVDKLNEELKGTPHAQVIRRSLCGTLCNQLIGTDPLQCTHTKESPEEFTTIQLEIKNKKTLEQSLQAYIVGETLMDKNAYKCNICQKKVSTLRRTVIATLPPTLAFVLKRFEMDFNCLLSSSLVRLSDGSTLAAGDVRVGMQLAGTAGPVNVVHAESDHAPAPTQKEFYRITLWDGFVYEATPEHRVTLRMRGVNQPQLRRIAADAVHALPSLCFVVFDPETLSWVSWGRRMYRVPKDADSEDDDISIDIRTFDAHAEAQADASASPQMPTLFRRSYKECRAAMWAMFEHEAESDPTSLPARCLLAGDLIDVRVDTLHTKLPPLAPGAAPPASNDVVGGSLRWCLTNVRKPVAAPAGQVLTHTHVVTENFTRELRKGMRALKADVRGELLQSLHNPFFFVDATPSGGYAYRKLEVGDAVRAVLLLHNDLKDAAVQRRNASGAKAKTFFNIERVLRELQVPVGLDGGLVIGELNPTCGEAPAIDSSDPMYDAIVGRNMRIVLEQLDARVIIACGALNWYRWGEWLGGKRRFKGVSDHQQLQDGVKFTFDAGDGKPHDVRVYFTRHPGVTAHLGQVRSRAAAAFLGISDTQTPYIRNVEKITYDEPQPFARIEVDGDHRYQLADGTLTHNSMTTNKINDRLEFPTEINMKPYTLEGLKERESSAKAVAAAGAGGASPAAAAAASSLEGEEKSGAASAAASSSASSAARPLHPPSYYQYVLRGVVVHSGTVGGGHYYSYIQDRSATGTAGWYEMNDKSVRPFDFKANLEAETFGGKDAGYSDWSLEKSRSGYILFYDRVKSKEVVSNELAQGTIKWRPAVRAVIGALRLRARVAKQRSALSPGLSATDAKIRTAQLAALQSAYAASMSQLQDGMAFNYASGLQFHHELFRDCGFGLRFLTDPLWHRQMTAAHQSIDLLRVGQYAFKHFLHIFVRSYSHTNLINNWKMLIKGAFEPRPDSPQPFPYEHVLPLAHWIVEYMCYMKPAKPVEVIDAATAAAIAAASLPDKPASSSSSAASKNTARSKDDSSSSTALVVAGPVKTHDVKGAPSGHKRGRSAEDLDFSGSAWEELDHASGGGGDYSSQIPPLDAPTSLLFQNIISCPQTDVRDALCDIMGAVATLIVGYENASKLQTLSPVMCLLVDHLCSFIPYIPFYASKALSGYLKLVYQMCRASELVVNRFMSYTAEATLAAPVVAGSSAPAASASVASAASAATAAAAPAAAASPKPQVNDFVARILDLYLGGVLSKDNPLGNSINNMPLASAKLRTYYPLTRDSLQASSTNTWKRALWTLMRVFITHADLTPLRVPPPEPKPSATAAAAAAVAATASAAAASALASGSPIAGLATEMHEVSLSDRVAEDKKEAPMSAAIAAVADGNGMPEAPAAASVTSASASAVAASASRRGSDASDDNAPDIAKPVLSPNAVQLLRFPGLLKALITDSYAHQRFTLVKELLLELSKNNLYFSKCVIQVLFALVEDDGPSPALFTHVRDQLRIADADAGARRLCVLEAWLQSLDSDQMFWTPTSNSLNYLLTFVTDKQGGQELVECMHQHVEKWKWLIDWIKLNKKMVRTRKRKARRAAGECVFCGSLCMSRFCVGCASAFVLLSIRDWCDWRQACALVRCCSSPWLQLERQWSWQPHFVG